MEKQAQQTPLQKVLSGLLILLICAGLLSLPAHFIPSEAYKNTIGVPSTIAYVALFGIVLSLLSKKPNPDWDLTLVFIGIFSLTAGSFLGIMLTYYGLPSLAITGQGQPYSMEVVVDRKTRSGRNRDGCQNKLKLAEFNDAWNGHVCVSRVGYQNTRLGDRLQISGQEAWFGRNITHFSRWHFIAPAIDAVSFESLVDPRDYLAYAYLVSISEI